MFQRHSPTNRIQHPTTQYERHQHSINGWKDLCSFMRPTSTIEIWTGYKLVLEESCEISALSWKRTANIGQARRQTRHNTTSRPWVRTWTPTPPSLVSTQDAVENWSSCWTAWSLNLRPSKLRKFVAVFLKLVTTWWSTKYDNTQTLWSTHAHRVTNFWQYMYSTGSCSSREGMKTSETPCYVLRYIVSQSFWQPRSIYISDPYDAVVMYNNSWCKNRLQFVSRKSPRQSHDVMKSKKKAQG